MLSWLRKDRAELHFLFEQVAQLRAFFFFLHELSSHPKLKPRCKFYNIAGTSGGQLELKNVPLNNDVRNRYIVETW